MSRGRKDVSRIAEVAAPGSPLELSIIGAEESATIAAEVARAIGAEAGLDTRLDAVEAVVGPQGAAVADADAGSIVDQFNALLARLRAHGLIAE